MPSLLDQAGKPIFKKKGFSPIVSCVEKFLEEGTQSSAMKRNVRKQMKELRGAFGDLIEKFGPQGENKAEKIGLDYHYVDLFNIIFNRVFENINSDLRNIPKDLNGNESDAKYFANHLLYKASPFMKFVKKVEEIADLDPGKCEPDQANRKAEEALSTAKTIGVTLGPALSGRTYDNDTHEVLLADEGCAVHPNHTV